MPINYDSDWLRKCMDQHYQNAGPTFMAAMRSQMYGGRVERPFYTDGGRTAPVGVWDGPSAKQLAAVARIQNETRQVFDCEEMFLADRTVWVPVGRVQ